MDEFDEPASAINKIVDALYVHLFSDPELNTYAVLDGASIPDLLEHLETDAPEHVCLYRGGIIRGIGRGGAVFSADLAGYSIYGMVAYGRLGEPLGDLCFK